LFILQGGGNIVYSVDFFQHAQLLFFKGKKHIPEEIS